MMMFHGVEIMQNIEMKTVALNMLIYFGAIPVMSFENGYVPAATWFPMVAKIKLALTKNFAARLSNLAMTAGIYLHNVSSSP